MWQSMDRKWIGSFARAMKCIPVVRPDDIVTEGSGFITVKGTIVTGHGGTRFNEEMNKGTVIKVSCMRRFTRTQGS